LTEWLLPANYASGIVCNNCREQDSAKSAAQLNAFDGTNFAVGGARTPDLALEISVYRNFFPTVDPGALYVFWIGGNDIRDIVRDPSSIAVPQAVANVILVSVHCS
jgi:hypothetical protein